VGKRSLQGSHAIREFEFVVEEDRNRATGASELSPFQTWQA
jgi:hypothetical protein